MRPELFSSLNDLKCIDSLLCSNLQPFKDADVPHSLRLQSSNKVKILSLSKVQVLSFGFVIRGKGHIQMTDNAYITLASRSFCIVQVTLT